MTKINLLTGRLLSGGRRIPLTQGQSAIVDDSDFERINQYKWYASWNPGVQSFYAYRKIRLPNGKQAQLPMHRQILGLEHVDHLDHNTLRNVRSNLRRTTPRGNHENQRNQSAYGVGVQRRGERFRFHVTIAGRKTFVGTFDSSAQASKAREEFLLK